MNADDLDSLRVELAQQREDIVRLRKLNEEERTKREAALEELAQQRLDAESAGIAGDDVYHRPALAAARQVSRKLNDAIISLSGLEESRGFGAVSIKAASDVLDDLALIGVAPVRGEIQSRRRDFVRRCFTHPGLLAVLGKSRPGQTYFAKFVLEQKANAYSEPGFRRIFEKASERYETTTKRR